MFRGGDPVGDVSVISEDIYPAIAFSFTLEPLHPRRHRQSAGEMVARALRAREKRGKNAQHVGA